MMSPTCRLLVLLTAGLTIHSEHAAASDGGSGAQTPALTPDEMFQDMFPLTLQNYTDRLLRNRDPWIVVFHEGDLERQWKTMAVHLRGLVWMGLVDTRQETDLLREMQYDPSTETVARVYPYGDRQKKVSEWQSAATPNEARSKATSFIPDRTSRLRAMDLEDFLVDCYSSSPSRFPVLYLTEEAETSPLLKALSVRFERYVNFGRVVKPTSDDLTKLGLSHVFVDTPALYVLITDQTGGEKFSAVQYDKTTFGPMNYTNVMQFMFAINSNFRYTLPGNSMADEQQEAEMSDVIHIERKRFDVSISEGSTSAENERKNEPEIKMSVESNIPTPGRNEL